MTTLIGLELAGRRVLVVGGGPAAARAVAGYLADGAAVAVIAPAVSEDLAAMAADGSVQLLPRAALAADLDEAWLIHAATGDPAFDELVAGWARDRRIWCVTHDRAPNSTAQAPAQTSVAGLAVGVVSGGAADSARAARVRDHLVDAIDSGAVDLRHHGPGQGRVTLVGGGPGAADLLTLRGMRALRAADVVITDRLGPTAVLEQLPAEVEVIDVGKTAGHHPVPQHEINRMLVEHAQRGRRVVRLKGGDPFLFGRGGEEVLGCHEAGVSVEVVPGVSSALAVPAAAGIPVTHRGTAAGVLVLSGHEGLPAAATAGLRSGNLTVVVLMGVAMLPTLLDQALAAGVDRYTPLAVVQRGSMPDQKVVRATLASAPEVLAQHDIQPPAVIVIGAAADLALPVNAESV